MRLERQLQWAVVFNECHKHKSTSTKSFVIPTRGLHDNEDRFVSDCCIFNFKTPLAPHLTQLP